MAKRLTSICLALCMLLALGITGMAYTLPADAGAVTVTQADGVYTVTISNAMYANADVSVVAVANGNEIPESMADSKVAYFSEMTADADGEAVFKFEPKTGFDNSKGLYVAVSTDRGIDTVIARATYTANITSAHGKVTLAQKVIKEGDTVNFDIEPAYGYVATKVTVNGAEVVESNEGGFVVADVVNNLAIVVEYEAAAAEISTATVFNQAINPSEFAEKYGEDMTEEAINAKYAAVLFSKVSSLSYECGIVYSKTNTDPTVDGADCIVKKAVNIGDAGSFGMYLYTDNESTDTYNVNTYVKSGDNYIYGTATTFTLSAVSTEAAE